MTHWLAWPPPIWLLVADLLATYRLGRLIMADEITKPIRDRVFDVAKDRGPAPFEGPIARVANPLFAFTIQMLTCPHCLTVWIGAGVVALTYLTPFAWSFAAVALALAAIPSLLHDAGTIAWRH